VYGYKPKAGKKIFNSRVYTTSVRFISSRAI